MITPPPQDETIAGKVRRRSAAVIAYVAAAQDPEDVHVVASIRRNKILGKLCKLRRVSARFVAFATEDDGIEYPGSNQVAPDPNATPTPAAEPQLN